MIKITWAAIAIVGFSMVACRLHHKTLSQDPYVPGKAPAEVLQWIIRANEKPVLVPADFVGMHLHRWPNIAQWELSSGRSISPVPPFPYGARRLWDYAEATAWASVDVGYSENENTERRDWKLMDEVVEKEAGRGKRVMVTINGTPTALSSKPTGTGKFPAWKGHQYAPKDSAAYGKLQKYVADLVSRYGTKISYIDTNNEPDPENPIPEADNFWVGTKGQHAEWHRMQRLAVPRGEDAPKLIGPSMVVWDWKKETVHPYSLSVLTAKDSKGVRLIDHLDGYGFHYYSRPTTDPIKYWEAITAMKATLKAAGKDELPMYDTEHGALDGTKWNDELRQIQATQILRHSVIAAGMGVKMIAWYSGDGNNLGEPSSGNVVSEALTTIHNDLTALEVREAAVLQDGRYWIRGLKQKKMVEFLY